MPRQSKIVSSSPGKAAPLKEQPDKYFCTRCSRSFTKQKGNFPGSQSPMFRENNGYLTICRHCVDEMYQHYKDVLGDEEAAIRRICLKFDIYWNKKIYAMLKRTSTTNSRVLSYISKANLYQFVGKTYDDTLDEEDNSISVQPTLSDTGSEENSAEDFSVITPEVKEFWGADFPPNFYMELERRFKYWCGDTDRSKMDVSDCAFIRQVCMLEVTIARDSALGKPIDKNINTLNTILGSANLKPIQKAKDESAGANPEAVPFGMWIKRIEHTRPISEPDPELQDVDRVVKYINVWFFGHLCKMLKIDNKYSRLYEAEMAKLRVERPEYEDEDDEEIIEDIYARADIAEAKAEVGE